MAHLLRLHHAGNHEARWRRLAAVVAVAAATVLGTAVAPAAYAGAPATPVAGLPAASGAAVAPTAAGNAGAAPAQAAHGVAGASAGGDYYDSGLDPTPYMGWNTYYGLGGESSEAGVKNVADFLVSSGLRDAGYNYVWLDGGWQASPPRDSHGQLAADSTRFPDGIPALVGYLHAHGLKAGIYTDAGVYDGVNCGLGSGGSYGQDAKQFASWKIDAIKVDFLCGIAQQLDPATSFTQFSAAVAASGRPMLLALCNPLTNDWGLPHTPAQDAGNSYAFGPAVADSWRTGTDIAFGDPTAGEWADVLRNMDANAAHPEANGPGHYNDPDNLIPMRRLPDGSYELSQEESTTQLVMWAEMASPLVIGSDPRTLSGSMLDTLENPEILAVDQDPLDVQGVRVATSSTGDVYSKVLSGKGNRAVVLLNRSAAAVTMTVQFSAAGLGGSVAVRDLRTRADQGVFSGSYTTTVPAHGTAMLRLSGANAAPGTDLGGRATSDPALVRFDDSDAAAFVRGADGSLTEQVMDSGAWTGRWSDLGAPVPGGILGQPAAYGSDGGRIDVFVRGADSTAYLRTWSGTCWGPWTSLGGTIVDAPTVAYTGPGAWSVYARGTDGNIWTRGAGTGWTGIGAPAGQRIYGRPSAVTDGSTTYVAVRTTDDSVWLRTRDVAGQWSDWTPLGGTVSGSPTLLATDGRVYLFARASDYTLWQRNFADGAWGGWFGRSEFPSAGFADALGTAAGSDGSAWVISTGADGHVRQTVL